MKQSEPKFETLSIETKYLFEQLCTEKKLLEGWREVRRNRGTSGIDGKTIESFELSLDKEVKQLQEGTADMAIQTTTSQTRRDT